MKKLTFILIFTLLLIASLISCDGAKNDGELLVEFNRDRTIFITTTDEQTLRSHISVTYTPAGGEAQLVEDYTISCKFTEGYDKVYVNYKDKTALFEIFFAVEDKLVYEDDYVFYRYGEKNQLLLLQYTGDATTLTLPERSEEYTIFDYAFENNTTLTEIDIGDSVSKIGKHAFLNCTALERVNFGGRITAVGSGAFTGCTALDYVGVDSLEVWCGITFNNSITLGNYLFSTVNGTGSNFGASSGLVTTPSGNVSISGNIAVSGGNSFVSGGVTTVIFAGSQFSVENKTGLQNSYQYKTVIENATLYKLSANGEKTLIRTLDVSNPLYYAKSLYVDGVHVEDLVIPNDVFSLKTAAFIGADIKSVTLHNSLTTFAESAFAYCSELDEVIIESLSESAVNNVYKIFDTDAAIYSEYLGGKDLGNRDNPYMILVSYEFGPDSTTPEIHPSALAIGAYAFGPRISFPDGVDSSIWL